MLSAQWASILKDHRTRKVLLVSLIFGREFTRLARTIHPGRMPGAVRGSTHPNVDVLDGTQSYPYWPTVTEWPKLEFKFSPVDRRADVASTTIRFMADAGIPIDELGVAGTPSGYARIDLWSDGIDLDHTIPLIVGPITNSKYNKASRAVTIEISDGDIRKKVEFPTGEFKIDREEFPNAPDIVAGYAPRSTMYGPFPDTQIPCYQIDREGKEFYVCEPALSAGPEKVYVGGVDVDSVEDVRFPQHTTGYLSDNRTYSKLVFDTPIPETKLVGPVTCSNGVGIVGEHPTIDLLKIGDYDITATARSLLRALPMNFFVFLNNKGSILEIVRDRLLPQTDLIGTLRRDKFHVYQLGGYMPEVSLTLGSGLVFRDTDGEVETSQDEIANAIEVRFQRDLYTYQETTRTTYLVDKDNGPFSIRNLLRFSERLYGRRYRKEEAPDVVQYLSESFSGTPVNIVNLAVKLAKTLALVHHEYTYMANWYEGMSVDLNYRAWLTDDELGITRLPTRVTGIEITPSGPRLTLQDEVV